MSEKDSRSPSGNPGGVLSVLDLCQAFDTVPHAVIRKSLERKGVPETVSTFIERMYEDCSTTIKGANGEVNIDL